MFFERCKKQLLPEKKVETNIKKWLENNGAFFIKTLGGSVPSGTPDILACLNGRFIGIEVKKPVGGKVSELQKLKIKEIQRAGGIAFVARSVKEVEEHLQNLL